LPNTPARAEQELLILNTLGTPVVARRGYGASDVEKIYKRARELCQELPSNSQLFPALRGLWAFHLVRAEYQTAYELGMEFLDMARNGNESGPLVEAHFLVGFTSQFLGNFASARAHSEKGASFYKSEVHRTLAFSFGVDPGVNCLSCGPLGLWPLGYPDQAYQMSCQALTLARELNHPFSMGWALIAATWLQQYSGDDNAVAEHADIAVALALEQSFPFWSAWARILRGSVLTKRSREREAVNQIREGLNLMRSATAAKIANTHFLGLLAEAYGKARKYEDGLAAVEEALIAVETTGERFYEAELLRLKGDLLGMGDSPDFDAAEDSFKSAIRVAQNQSAKSWELRATTSLARLLVQRGDRDEARSMLRDIYNWFTEGFDTADLKDAKALLDELSN
jgi:predicted ATPase